MKERPILFSGPMVRAILDGRKSQTRRVVKLRDKTGTYSDFGDDGWPESADECGDWHRDPCPYGIPGDRLWVRETWQFQPASAIAANGKYVYAATVKDGHHPPSWRPSIHMPRVASRLTLAVKAVRVERLQEISEADAVAEGTTPGNVAGSDVDIDGNVWNGAYRRAYAALWDSINGPGSWAANPWVWVVEFDRKEVKDEQ
jgi:hypothetical protein